MVTRDNYFNPEIRRQYMSFSRLKAYTPELGGCEARQWAIDTGEWEDTGDQVALMQGRYFHAWSEGVLEQFKAANYDQLYAKTGRTAGQLKADYKLVDEVIAVCEDDDNFMAALDGEKEVVGTATMFGVEWQFMMDVLNRERGFFTDLKLLKSLYDKFWNGDHYENVFEYRGYFLQIAIYAELYRLQHQEDDWLTAYEAVATKQAEPDHDIIGFNSADIPYSDFITYQLTLVERYTQSAMEVINRQRPARRCEKCDYCLRTKKITRVRHYSEFSLY